MVVQVNRADITDEERKRILKEAGRIANLILIDYMQKQQAKKQSESTHEHKYVNK